MRTIFAALLILSSLSVMASDDLLFRLMSKGIVCNQEEAKVKEAIKNLMTDINNAEFKLAVDKAIKEFSTCTKKVNEIARNDSMACNTRIELLLSQNIICNAEKYWLEVATEIHEQAPSINTSIDMYAANEEYSACSERAYDLCL